MTVRVEMYAEEFQEFMEWKKDKNCYAEKNAKLRNKTDVLVEKVFHAIEPDPNREGFCKVADEDHLSELYDMALEW